MNDINSLIRKAHSVLNENRNAKYELTDEVHPRNRKLRRIRALRDIPRNRVRAGDLGGVVESEDNLSQSGDAWIADDAQVFERAHVSGEAYVSERAHVSGNASVSGEARVSDKASVSGKALVFGYAIVSDNARVSGNAWVYDNVQVSDNASVTGDARVSGKEEVSGIDKVS